MHLRVKTLLSTCRLYMIQIFLRPIYHTINCTKVCTALARTEFLIAEF